MKRFGVVFALVALSGIAFFIGQRVISSPETTVVSPSPATAPIPQRTSTPKAEASRPAGKAPSENAESAPDRPTAVALNARNFESLVARCFQGQPCELLDAPWKMYEEFKSDGNPKASDDLIAWSYTWT